jgi:hypothetical protein
MGDEGGEGSMGGLGRSPYGIQKTRAHVHAARRQGQQSP